MRDEGAVLRDMGSSEERGAVLMGVRGRSEEIGEI